MRLFLGFILNVTIFFYQVQNFGVEHVRSKINLQITYVCAISKCFGIELIKLEFDLKKAAIINKAIIDQNY